MKISHNIILCLALFPVVLFGQKKPGISYAADASFEKSDFIGLVRYTHIEPDPPYEALSFQIWDIQKAQKTQKAEMDSLIYMEVIRNMSVRGQKPTTCPAGLVENFAGYEVSCASAEGKQDSNIYYFELIAIRKGGLSQWISVTRSNNPNLRTAEVEKFIQSLKPLSKAFLAGTH